MFSLILDDFGIQYVGKNMQTTSRQCSRNTTTSPWTGQAKNTGVKLKWDYIKQPLRLTMDTYVLDILLNYSHSAPSKP